MLGGLAALLGAVFVCATVSMAEPPASGSQQNTVYENPVDVQVSEPQLTPRPEPLRDFPVEQVLDVTDFGAVPDDDENDAAAPVGEASSELGAAAARFERYLEHRLPGLAHAPIVFASALEGERVAEAAKLAGELARKARTKHPTSKLNKMVQRALRVRKPPSPRGQFPKVYYATQMGISPPTVALFVNDPRRFSPTYVKFLSNRFREYWDEGVGEVPVRVVLKARPRR